jgi:hypothetical protein
MSHAIDDSAFDRATDPLFKLLTADQLRRLITLAPDHELEARITDLAARAQEEELPTEVRAEYEAYVRANNLLAVLQGIARRRLSPSQTVQ